MAVKILCAGCSKDEREAVESRVRQALTRAAGDGSSWTVSLVKIGHRWSVSLSEESRRGGQSFVATDGELEHSLVTALQPEAPAAAAAAPAPARAAAPAPAPAPARPAGTVPASRPAPAPASPARSAPSSSSSSSSTRVSCIKCARPFAVVYEPQPDDEQEEVAAACPHCWQINRALIPAEAALTRDYRTEKLEG